jgi:hypothetical protein
MASSSSPNPSLNNPSCYTTTTLFPCGTNLLDWLLSNNDQILGKGSNKSYPQETLERILDKGIVTTKCNVCCPCEDGGYVLASVETFLKYAEALVNNNEAEFTGDTCCSSFPAAVESTLDECFTTSNINCTDRILDKGIVEQGLINGQSQLQHAIDWIISIMPLVGTTSTACEILERIIDIGIVIFCEKDTDRVIIAGVETFLKWNEAIVPEINQVTCCTNVHASVETYLIYAEVIGLTGGGPVPA